MDVTGDLFNCLKAAVERIDKGAVFVDSGQKEAAEDTARQQFVASLGEEFFELYAGSDQKEMQNRIRIDGLFAPCCGAYRRATYGAKSQFEGQLEKLQMAFEDSFPGSQIPDRLDEVLQRLREDFGSLAITKESSLVRIRNLADRNMQYGEFLSAYESYTRLLASKPYVRGLLTNIGDMDFDSFFWQIKLSALRCSPMADDSFSGVRLGAQLAAHQADWYAASSCTPEAKQQYWVSIGLVIYQSSDSLLKQFAEYDQCETNPKDQLRAQAENISQAWSLACKHADELGHAPWELIVSPDSVENVEIKDRLADAFSALRRLKKKLEERNDGNHPLVVEFMKGLRANDLLDHKFKRMTPSNYSLQDFKPYPSDVDQIPATMLRASNGERIKFRNFLVYGVPGAGKSHLLRAVAQAAMDASRTGDGVWKKPVEVFEMTDSNVMSSTFDGSRNKIDTYFKELVAASKEAGFVPVIILDEIDKYLGPNGDQQENERIMHAFLSNMDDVSEDNRVLMLCTTNYLERIEAAGRDRFFIIELGANMAMKAKALLASNAFDAKEIEVIKKGDFTLWSKKEPSAAKEFSGFLPSMLGYSFFMSLREIGRCVDDAKERAAKQRGVVDCNSRERSLYVSMIISNWKKTKDDASLRASWLENEKEMKQNGYLSSFSGPAFFAKHWWRVFTKKDFLETLDLFHDEEELTELPAMSVVHRNRAVFLAVKRDRFCLNTFVVDLSKESRRRDRKRDIFAWICFRTGADAEKAKINENMTQSFYDQYVFTTPPAGSNLEKRPTREGDYYFEELRKNAFDFVTFHLAFLEEKR